MGLGRGGSEIAFYGRHSGCAGTWKNGKFVTLLASGELTNIAAFIIYGLQGEVGVRDLDPVVATSFTIRDLRIVLSLIKYPESSAPPSSRFCLLISVIKDHRNCASLNSVKKELKTPYATYRQFNQNLTNRGCAHPRVGKFFDYGPEHRGR